MGVTSEIELKFDFFFDDLNNLTVKNMEKQTNKNIKKVEKIMYPDADMMIAKRPRSGL